jgi:2,5-diamino-6-(ribosylamino)-4(3H)-pyrimidinone 5'-phosphate reductase
VWSMDEVAEISEDDKAFICPYLPGDGTLPESADDDMYRPFVTLTYASSMDGMISLSPGVRTTLSGPETKSMTHYLRSKHDAILVGVGTAIADDPSLTCRYPRGNASTAIQPLVLDPLLRWDVQNSKAMALAREGRAKVPWVLHSSSAYSKRISNPDWKYVAIPDERPSELSDRDGGARLQWLSILSTLKRNGINSVMIEGGATIITDLLEKPRLVDSVIVTIAPTWLGQGGVTVSPYPRVSGGIRVNAARLKHTAWRQFGEDAVVCGRPG